jgi:cytochrome c
MRKRPTNPAIAGVVIYRWRPYRMPHLGLSADEADVMAKYIAKVGSRSEASPVRPDPAKLSADKVEAGKTLFVVTCAQCHSLGKVVETQPINQQGPDLIHAAERVDFEWAKSEWAKKWIGGPKAIDPKTRMNVAQLSPDQVEQVRLFVWKAALGAGSGGGGGGAGGN